MADRRTERRTDTETDRQMTDGRRRTERWTAITGTQAQLKVFNELCETLHRLAGRGQRDGVEGRETGQRAERQGRETEGGGVN